MSEVTTQELADWLDGRPVYRWMYRTCAERLRKLSDELDEAREEAESLRRIAWESYDGTLYQGAVDWWTFPWEASYKMEERG